MKCVRGIGGDELGMAWFVILGGCGGVFSFGERSFLGRSIA